MSRARAVREAKTELADLIQSSLRGVVGIRGSRVTVESADQCWDDPKVVQVTGRVSRDHLNDDEWDGFTFDVHIREVTG